MRPVSEVEAHKDRMSHAYKHGLGYLHVGKLPVPKQAAYAPSACEPPAPSASETKHFLSPPLNAPAIGMIWYSDKKEWTPLHPGNGNRVGFTSEYLAAHGWTYLGPMPPA